MTLTDHSIVLDLDETLVRTLAVNESQEDAYKIADTMGIYTKPEYMDIRLRSYRLMLDDPVTSRGSGQTHGCWGVTRPHLNDFLVFAFSYFKTVNIWSAGVDDYVRKIAKHITRRTDRFHHIFTRDNCVNHEDEFTKPLDKMIKEYPDIGPIERVFVLDDRELTFQFNKNNGILMPLYKPAPTENSLRMDDDNLLKLKYWFLSPEVINCRDITKLDKKDIFNRSIHNYKFK